MSTKVIPAADFLLGWLARWKVTVPTTEHDSKAKRDRVFIIFLQEELAPSIHGAVGRY